MQEKDAENTWKWPDNLRTSSDEQHGEQRTAQELGARIRFLAD